MWSSYWYNGRIYTNNHCGPRGRVYKLKGFGRKQVKYFKGGLNPQTQIADFK